MIQFDITITKEQYGFLNENGELVTFSAHPCEVEISVLTETTAHVTITIDEEWLEQVKASIPGWLK